MTVITAPDYSAVLLRQFQPYPTLNMRDDDGVIVLDSARAPHVEGTITCALDETLLDELNPRQSRRIYITAGGRTFDLGLRGALPNRNEGTVQLRLASDEALLEDYAPLIDDPNPRLYEASLRAVVNYVLERIGAELEPGDTDADATACWEVVNRATNPNARTNAAGWSAGAGTSSVVKAPSQTILGAPTVRYTAAGVGAAYLNTPTQDVRVTPGERVTAQAHIISATVSRDARLMLRFKDQSGQVVQESFSDPVVTTLSGTAPALLYLTRIVPPNATTISVYVNTLTNSTGQFHYVNGLMLHDQPEALPPFDGATTGPDYAYIWDDLPDVSTSRRVPLVERRPEALTWPAGRSALEFIIPLVQAAGLRLVCDERRRWTLRDETHRAEGALTYRVGVNVIEASEEVTRAADEWYNGAVFVYRWTDANGAEQTRTDAFAYPTATKIIRREINAPYPGPGRAEYAVRRAQGRGRAVTVTAQATWDENTEQPLSVGQDGTPLQTGIANRVEFDLAANTVRIEARTTDTPPGAIRLLPGTINALTGTINDL